MVSKSTVTSTIRGCKRACVFRGLFLGLWGLVVFALSIHVTVLTPEGDCVSQYLLMKPITSAVATGRFELLKNHTTAKLSVNLEAPFRINGYLSVDKFVEDIKAVWSQYDIANIQWVTKQIEHPFAVESLNLYLKNQRSQKSVNYKFIFFMTKVDGEWKIYYLRGLNF